MQTESFEARCAREAAERQARQIQFAAIAKDVAKLLGATAELHGDHDASFFRLALEGRAFYLGFNRYGNPGRVEVSAAWPSEKMADGSSRMITPRDLSSRAASPSITIAVDRGAKAIASGITKRFLPAFAPLYDQCAERATMASAAGLVAIHAAQELAREHGTKIKASGQSAQLWIAGQALRVDAYGGNVSVRFDHAFSCSMDQARRILNILAESA